MNAIPALDLRPSNDFHPNDPAGEGVSSLPANIDAEQALLGAVLYDNAALHLVEVR